MRCFFKSIFVFAPLFFALSACNDEEFVLAFGFPNEELTYETSANLTALFDGLDSSKESMKTALYLRSTYALLAAYDDGSARYEVRIDSLDYASDKMSVEELTYVENSGKTRSFRYKISSDGEILEYPDLSLMPSIAENINIAKQFVKLQPVLPKKPVSVGETWEREHVMQDGNSTTVVYKEFKLADVFYRNGVRIALIAMRVKYKQNDDDSAFKIESDDLLVGEGTCEFNIAEGTIEKVSLEVQGKLKIQEKTTALAYPDCNVHQTLKMRKIGGE